jgi:molybdopterin synthase catalytic subunit
VVTSPDLARWLARAATEPFRVSSLLRRAEGVVAELERYRPYTLFAVGHDYVLPEYRLRPDDELCLFPPVSGGNDDLYRVVDMPLSPDAIATAVDDPGAGGIVIFSGVVRNETGGRPVKFLEYEAHAPMAEGKMRKSDRPCARAGLVSSTWPSCTASAG